MREVMLKADHLQEFMLELGKGFCFVARQKRITLDGDAPHLVGATPADIADRWLFSGNRNLVDRVEVAGREVVRGGRHVDREGIAARYAVALKALLAG